MKIKDRMTHDPITVDVSLPIPEAMKLMKSGGFRRLPVLEHGKLVGIVTDRDVREAMPSDATSLSIWEINYLITRITVKEIMTKPAVTINEDASVERAAQLMLEHKIGGLPVMSGAKVVGIISVTDVLWLFLEWSKRDGLTGEEDSLVGAR
jgi:acetoin utilization protein AcuB